MNVTAIYAFYVRSRLFVLGDAAQMARNVAASARLFRVGVATELLTVVGVVVLLWALYVALKPVGEDVALLAVFFRLGARSLFEGPDGSVRIAGYEPMTAKKFRLILLLNWLRLSCVIA